MTFLPPLSSLMCEHSSAIFHLLSLSFLRSSCRHRSLLSQNVEGSGKSYLRVGGIILLGMQIKPFKGSDELPELLACLKKGGGGGDATESEKERSFVTAKMETKSA